MAEALLIDARDDVATILEDAVAGERAAGVTLTDPVTRGHKLALRAIDTGEPVHKFGYPIGRATRPIRAGEHVILEPVEDPQRRIFAKAAKGERIKYRRKHFGVGALAGCAYGTVAYDAAQ